MADLSQTITNTLDLFGPATTNNWGSITWGTHKWGYGDVDLQVDFSKLIAGTCTVSSEISSKEVDKLISNQTAITTEQVKEVAKLITNTQTVTDAYIKDFAKAITAGEIDLTDSLVKDYSYVLGLTVTLTEDIYQLTLRDSAGYYHVFQGATTDAHNRASNVFTASTATSSVWSGVTQASTSWS